MQIIYYYDDPAIAPGTASVFLAGPTAREGPTPWRAEALRLVEAGYPEATVVVPEFRDLPFKEARGPRFDDGQKPAVPHMSRASERILEWETAGIDGCRVLLVWMPFSEELPGRTTRSEVARAIARVGGEEVHRIVLGIPPGTDATGHIRYHASRAGVEILPTLEQCVARVVRHLVIAR